VEKYGRARQATDDNIILRMRIVCWITKAIDTHSEYVMLIAYPRQQWSREHVSMFISTLLVLLNLYSRLNYIIVQCIPSREFIFCQR
jgi:hypothetical protein